MATLAPLYVSHLAYEVLQAGYWFRVDGDRLYVTARRPDLAPFPAELAQRVRKHKPAIIAAIRPIPPACPNPASHLYAGRCLNTACMHLEATP